MSISKDRWQKRDAFVALLEKGDYQGFVTHEEILTVFPEAEESEERLERLRTFFREAGVEVYEDISQVPIEYTPDVQGPDGESFDLSAISSDDTVGLYLKEMARVPLLTTEARSRPCQAHRARQTAAEVRLRRLNGNGTPKKRLA